MKSSHRLPSKLGLHLHCGVPLDGSQEPPFLQGHLSGSAFGCSKAAESHLPLRFPGVCPSGQAHRYPRGTIRHRWEHGLFLQGEVSATTKKTWSKTNCKLQIANENNFSRLTACVVLP